MTPLTNPIRRALELDGEDYTVTIDAEGVRVARKGHRHGRALAWRDLISGDAELTAQLKRSLARGRKGRGSPPTSRQRATSSTRRFS